MEEKMSFSESLTSRLDLLRTAESLGEVRDILEEDIPTYNEEEDSDDELFIESANLRFFTLLGGLAKGMDLNAMNDASRQHFEVMTEILGKSEVRARNRASIIADNINPTQLDRQYWDRNLEIITQLIESLKPGVLHSDTQFKININPEGPDSQSLYGSNRFAGRLSADIVKLAENGYKEIAVASMLLFHYRHALSDGYYGATRYDLTPNRAIKTVLHADLDKRRGFTSVQWFDKTEEEIKDIVKFPWSKNIKFLDRRLALADRYLTSVKEILGVTNGDNQNNSNEQMLSLLCTVIFENMSVLRAERNQVGLMPEGEEIPMIFNPENPDEDSMRYKILLLIAQGELDSAKSLIEHRVIHHRTLTNPRVAYIARLNLPEDFFAKSTVVLKSKYRKFPKDSL